MTVTVPLTQYAVVTLNGQGNGTAQLGPRSLREKWTPSLVSVSTNQAPAAIVNQAQCQVFEGEDTTQPCYIGGTLSGSTGDSTTNLWGPLTCGQYVYAVWTGGDPGAQAVLKVTGTKDIS
ncbi:MAG TPA: hypothetical protein VGG25_10330 [Streptosporangiaceae bacterium]|jgi:hypothetical protein